VLDKTGTVTTGRMSLVNVHVDQGVSISQVLRLAGALEDASGHPIAMAIASAAVEYTGQLPPAENFQSIAGYGVHGIVDDHHVVVGRLELLDLEKHPFPTSLAVAKYEAEASGCTTVTVAWDGVARGVLVIADTVKPTSAEAIAEFRRLGLRPVLLTGDSETVARAIGQEVGISELLADVSPEDKVDAIKALQARGHVVAMVGDGVNDAAALATADLGLSMGTGTDVAIEAGDLTLVRGDLLAAVDAIRLSRKTLSTIKTNLFWAFGYNFAAIPLAAAGLLNPMIAGATMALSSFVVVSNSLRLSRFRGTTPAGDR
jgi:Cu+-exporting ATPase